MKTIFFITAFLFVGCNSTNKQKELKNLQIPSASASIEQQKQTLPKEINQSNSSCKENMILVSGNYCTDVKQECEIWIEDPSKNKFARCKKFKPSICIGERIHMQFCIDKEEMYFEESKLPKTNISWTECKNECEYQGKRLCSPNEWTFACEGEDSLPYPYGLERNKNYCNIDTESIDQNKENGKKIICGKELCDLRHKVTEDLNCISPFGVHNMTGNVDEWVISSPYNHSKIPNFTMRSVLKGGHWLPIRARCRPETRDHDEGFKQISIGCRCCSNKIDN